MQMGPNKWERFSDYIKKKQERLRHQLTIMSLNNDNISVLDVIENLVMKKEMNGVDDSMVSEYKPRFSMNSQVSSKMSNVGGSI